MHVLIVEDDPDHAQLVERALTKEDGWRVDHAETLAKARSLVDTQPYDLVVLDYRLPDGDGTDLLIELGRRSRTLPVLFLTGQGDEEVAMQAIRHGAVDYLVKGPAVEQRLRARVKEVVTGWTNQGPLVTLESGSSGDAAGSSSIDPEQRKAISAALRDIVVGPVLGGVVAGPGGSLVAAEVPNTVDAERVARWIHEAHAGLTSLDASDKLAPRRYTIVTQSSQYLAAAAVAPGPFIVVLLMRRSTSELIGLRRAQDASRKIWEAT